jgi:hypothetical protein
MDVANSVREGSAGYPKEDSTTSEGRGTRILSGVLCAALISLGAISFMASLVSSLATHNTIIYGSPPFQITSVFTISLAALIGIVFVVCGVATLVGGFGHLSKSGVKVVCCIMSAVADFTLGLGTVVMAMCVLDFSSTVTILAFFSSTVTIIFGIIGLSLFALAGVLYIISGSVERMVGKANALLIVIGILLVAYIPAATLTMFTQSFIFGFDGLTLYALFIAPSIFLFVALGLRGIALLNTSERIQTATDKTGHVNDGAPANSAAFADQVSAGVAINADAPSGGFVVLGFFFPLVGLILWLVWKNQYPLRANSCGIGALTGFIVNLVSACIFSVLPLVFFLLSFS